MGSSFTNLIGMTDDKEPLRSIRQVVLPLFLCAICLIQGLAAESKDPAPTEGAASWPRYTLQAAQVWQLNLPAREQFDASGLLITKQGELLTINDRGSTLYRIDIGADSPNANLVPLTDCFTTAQLQAFRREKSGRYDCEGIAQDDEGRFYICEEANRWIMRCDPNAGTVDRLQIDWSPVARFFTPFDSNASFEGVAIGGAKLYVANERMLGRIITVDLKTLAVEGAFYVSPTSDNTRDVHYSDLSWFGGSLYALLREEGCVLQVNPETHQVTARFDFQEMQNAPEYRYEILVPGTGYMEGLAIDAKYIWLVTDNNGLGRVKHPGDRRPTLFKCRRPDIAP